MRTFIIMTIFFMLLSLSSLAKQFYASNFESENIGSTPRGWEIGYKGNGKAQIIADPENRNNKVFAHSDLPKDKARHDVNGVMWIVGDMNWQDYIIEYDAYFPDDFYMGTVFRFSDPEKFYLFDRRSAGEAGNFDFWRRSAGAWTRFGTGKFDAQPKKWYRFRIVAKGDTFQAYGKSSDDATPFKNLKPILEGKEATFEKGCFGLYGLIYVDNVVIGETEDDMTISVEPNGKLASTWGDVKGILTYY